MRFIPVGLVKRKPEAILKFNMSKWISLAQLLEKGYSINSSITLIDPNHKQLLVELDQGKNIEDILILNGKGRFYQHVQFFLKVTSLSKALQNAVSMVGFEQSLKQKLWKQTAYPFFIFIFSFITLYLFTQFIIPQMLMSFDMNQDSDYFVFILRLINYLVSVLIVLLTLLLIFIAICFKNHILKMKMIYILSKYTTLFSSYNAYLLSGYLLELRKSGLSSKECFLYLSQTRDRTILNETSSRFKTQLESGMDINMIIQNEILLSHKFKEIYRIASALGNLDDACHDFMELQEQEWIQQIKRFALVIQCIAYSFVAVLVIMVYRIMLLPLELLNEM